MSTDILNGVNCYLIQKAKNNSRDYSYFHASSWNECFRKTAYQYYEAKGLISLDGDIDKFDPQRERIYDNGHYLHFRWKDYLENAVNGALLGRWRCRNESHSPPKIFGLEEELGCSKPNKCECGCNKFDYIEVGFRDEETMLGGHVDAILDCEKWGISKAPSRFLVIDYKSMTTFMFKDLKEPLPKHQSQMQMYFLLSGLEAGKFIYENKDNQSVKEFLVQRDESFVEKSRKEAIRLKYIVTHTNSEGKCVLPRRTKEFSRGHKLCLSCRYRYHCWKE